MPARTTVAVPARPATEDDLRATPRDGQKYELVDGEIRVSPAGARHEAVSLKLASRLLAYVASTGAGHAFGSSVGFRLPGGNVRSPDASFVASGRFPGDTPPDDFGDLAPDLAVEVLSPSERPRHVLDKVGEYLEAGVRAVWVIDPRKAKAITYRSLSDVTELGADDDLEGGDVLPGFRCRLADIL
jgi:Uma2 family endonuclease